MPKLEQFYQEALNNACQGNRFAPLKSPQAQMYILTWKIGHLANPVIFFHLRGWIENA